MFLDTRTFEIGEHADRQFSLYYDLKTEGSDLRCTGLCSIYQVRAHPWQCCPCDPDQNKAMPAGGGDDGET